MPATLPSTINNEQDAQQATLYIQQQPWYRDLVHSWGVAAPGDNPELSIPPEVLQQMQANPALAPLIMSQYVSQNNVGKYKLTPAQAEAVLKEAKNHGIDVSPDDWKVDAYGQLTPVTHPGRALTLMLASIAAGGAASALSGGGAAASGVASGVESSAAPGVTSALPGAMATLPAASSLPAAAGTTAATATAGGAATVGGGVLPNLPGAAASLPATAPLGADGLPLTPNFYTSTTATAPLAAKQIGEGFIPPVYGGTGSTMPTASTSLMDLVKNYFTDPKNTKDIIGGAASIIGGAIPEKSSTAGTSTPTWGPEYTPLHNAMLAMTLSRLTGGGPATLGYEGSGVSNINKTYQAAQTGLNANLTARGLARSPVAATAATKLNTARAGDIATFRNSIPLLQDQLQRQNLADAGGVLSLGRGTSTTSDTSSGGGVGGAFNSLAAYMGYLNAKNKSAKAAA